MAIPSQPDLSRVARHAHCGQRGQHLLGGGPLARSTGSEGIHFGPGLTVRPGLFDRWFHSPIETRLAPAGKKTLFSSPLFQRRPGAPVTDIILGFHAAPAPAEETVVKVAFLSAWQLRHFRRPSEIGIAHQLRSDRDSLREEIEVLASHEDEALDYLGRVIGALSIEWPSDRFQRWASVHQPDEDSPGRVSRRRQHDRGLGRRGDGWVTAGRRYPESAHRPGRPHPIRRRRPSTSRPARLGAVTLPDLATALRACRASAVLAVVGDTRTLVQPPAAGP